MKAKEHQVNTVQDMIDCTNESNLDNFLTDLKGMLAAAHLFREIGEGNGIKDGLISKGFTWIDDGAHEITIYLESNDN